MVIIPSILLFCLIAYFGFFLFKIFSSIFLAFYIENHGKNPFRYIDLFPAKLSLAEESILTRYFDYYKNLPPQLKPIFKSRLSKFMVSKSFETRKDLPLNNEIKVLVSAAAIQLTFGLKGYLFPHFDRIIIYPQKYLSRITKKFHLGEANPKGVVVFSWEDFLKGYSDPNDNINLGLHEFAHALFINFSKNTNLDMNLSLYYNEWKSEGYSVFRKLKTSKNKYFRPYAQTNMMEFFAVSVEYFFETPSELAANYPDLYKVISKLLGQDPQKWIKPNSLPN